MAYWDSAIVGITSLLGGLLDTSGEDAIKAAQAGSNKKYAYPTQKSIAKDFGPYLWEGIGKGLTGEEKDLYRGEGKTSILQASKGAQTQASRTSAAQGLRGGTIANILAGIQSQEIPAMAGLETGIMGADINKKQTNIANLMSFLGLAAGEEDPAYGSNQSIASIINKLYPGGGEGGNETDEQSYAKEGSGGSFGWDWSGASKGLVLGAASPMPGGTILGGILGGLIGGYNDADEQEDSGEGYDADLF